MKIDTSKIESELQKLDNSIAEYEKEILNIEKMFSSISFFWQDGKSKEFFDDMYLKKNEIDVHIIDLKSYSQVYNSLVNQYKTIGNKVIYNKDMRDEMSESITDYIDKVSKIIELYDGINTFGVDDIIIQKLDTERKKMINVKDSLIEYRSKMKNIFEKITDIEVKTSSLINKLDINNLKFE